MKKGCFLSFIIGITLFVMVGMYVFKTNKNWFKEFGKDKLTNLISGEMDEHINKLAKNPFKDSLHLLIKREVRLVKESKFKDAMDRLGYTFRKIKQYTSDGVIDSLEFSKIKLLVLEDERSKEN